MVKNVSERKTGEIPPWFHHHGDKMTVEKLDVGIKLLVITASAAGIKITRWGKSYSDGWIVEWWIRHGVGKVKGQTWMAAADLRSAFGLENNSRFSDWLLARFDGDCAGQGEYIRYGNYLNIPCPGTGSDGDPNVSVFLTKEIKEAVQKLTS